MLSDAPFRVVLVWDGVLGGDAARMCGPTSVSYEDDVGEKRACLPTNALTAGKLAMANATLRFGAAWCATAFGVRPVVGALALDAATATPFPLPAASAFENADQVVLLTMRPDPTDATAGFARCLQRDQRLRCTVGWLNWSPEQMAADALPGASAVGAALARRLVVHELLHLQEAVLVEANAVDAAGAPVPTSSLFATLPDPARNRSVNAVVSPGVVARARAAFNCSTLRGVPLEDLPLGAGAHWETRLMGPEVMTYGEMSGEPYVSDLTLQFVEDVGHLSVNYAAAGPLLPLYTAANATPGAMRWGRGQGCAFADGPTSGWDGGAADGRYVCPAQGADGCSFDNRMAAQCQLQTPTPVETARVELETCVPQPSGVRCAPPVAQTLPAGPGGLPLGFGLAGGAQGGTVPSFDAAPVRWAYRSCADASTASADGASGGEGSLSAPDAYFLNATRAGVQFGGQVTGPASRCFRSSLQNVFTFPAPGQRLGLCYPANCADAQTLQVGVSQPCVLFLSAECVAWYTCPPAGGDLYVPRFIGALACPPAAAFCAFEPLSGVLFAERPAWTEWAAYGVVLGVPALAALAFFVKPGAMRRLCCGQAERAYRLRKGVLKRTSDGGVRALFVWERRAVGALGVALLGGVGGYIGALTRGAISAAFRPTVLPLAVSFGVFGLVALYAASVGGSGKFWALLAVAYTSALGAAVGLSAGALALARPGAFLPLVHLFSSAAAQAHPPRAGGWFAGGLILASAACTTLYALATRMASPLALAVSLSSALHNVFWFAGTVGALFVTYARAQVKLPAATWLVAWFCALAGVGAGGVLVHVRRLAAAPRPALLVDAAACVATAGAGFALTGLLGRWAPTQADPLVAGTAWLFATALAGLSLLTLVAAVATLTPGPLLRRYAAQERAPAFAEPPTDAARERAESAGLTFVNPLRRGQAP